ncbi:fatty acid synthase alpha subunit Lsd1, partial [Kickxella alabastrina]
MVTGAAPIAVDGQQQVTPMVSVVKLTREQLKAAIDRHNSMHALADKQVHLSLTNGARMFVVSGVVESLGPFVQELQREFDSRGNDQSRVAFSQRKPGVLIKFLSINAPYHCALLQHATEGACAYATHKGWLLDLQDMRRPVRASNDGHDIRSEPNIAHYLLQSMCMLPVDWPMAVACKGITHVVDFGPGGANGFGAITQRILEGRGVAVVCAGAFPSAGVSSQQQRLSVASKIDLYASDASLLLKAADWGQQFRPRLVRTKFDGQLQIDTPMSRLLGKPPVMVAGMTPSTVSEVFVSAVMRAGYHIELSGGGHFTEAMLRAKVDKILTLVGPGLGITVNSIYVNPSLWNTQYPAVQEMRREGVPMEGLCIGAGVPSFDVCNEIISSISAVGFRHIGLKPGSVATIRLVIKIAQANPNFPILLQWTSGRAGGHHSFEDFHQPILETYGAIRAQRNIVLVAGSGFGGVDDTLPYLTGEWSRRFDCAPMPFDGCLFGSRVMVAKEGMASDAVKEAIVAAPGIDDSEWERTYQGPAGGIVTVMSEMGEPIHKIATRGVMLWKEMDDTIFSLPREKRLAVLMAKKDYIIRRLNDDFQKPWFGRKADGRPADLEEMTYAEVANRMVEVLYISHQSRWIDITMRNLVGDYLVRLEERFSTAERPALLQAFDQLNDPFAQVQAIVEAYPEGSTQLLATEDVQHFINLCMRPGQKPVPFIPVMDKDFHVWFKKDSLWQAEDVDAVPGQDVGRVCILQGPVAARYATKANEPVKSILDGIYHGQIAALLERYYGGDASAVPTVEYLAASAPARTGVPQGVTATLDGTAHVFSIAADARQLPEADAWLEALGGSKPGWLRALLTTASVVQGQRVASNFVRQALRPAAGQVARVALRSGQPVAVVIAGASGGKEAEISALGGSLIAFRMFAQARGRQCALELRFVYAPQTGAAVVHEVMAGRTDRIRRFYTQLWFDDVAAAARLLGPAARLLGPAARLCRGPDIVATQDDVAVFCAAIGAARRADSQAVPLDYAMRAIFPVLGACLLSAACGGDLGRLVHVSNAFTRVSGAAMRVGAHLRSEARLAEVVDGPAGRTASIRGHVLVDGRPAVAVHSAFLFRGSSGSAAGGFRLVDEPLTELRIRDRAALARVRAKEWFVPAHVAAGAGAGAGGLVRVGATLRFRLASRHQLGALGRPLATTTSGPVLARLSGSAEWTHVADVDCEGSAALGFLARHGEPAEKTHAFGGRVLGSYDVQVPRDASGYAKASGDLNPIHTHAAFAAAAGLPGPITHGMWTSAAVRGAVEAAACGGDGSRMASYSARFVGVVLPGESLAVRVRVVGLRGGRLLVAASADAGAGRVLDASAEIDAPRTALLFGGQGTQAAGMGMALYAASPAARGAWDAADAALRDAYGVSLLHVVRNNPRSATVHFAGPRGARVRAALRALLPAEIAPDAASHAFTSPRGLLHATQFSQAALLVAAVAEAEHLRARGAFPADAAFAGHSLGEFAALAAVARLFSAEAAATVGFVRGLTMQRAVRRDPASGRSPYALLAVSPARVAPCFGAAGLDAAVKCLAAAAGGGLLEVVNHNVHGAQYVVAGETRLLAALAVALGQISGAQREVTKAAAAKALGRVDACADSDELAALLASRATLPVPGVDMPFHSSLLRPGVAVFRSLLLEHLPVSHVHVARLRGRYVPNLTAAPFDITRRYFESVHTLTGSGAIGRALDTWNDKLLADRSHEQRLAHTLLVEVLAHQLAAPVRWIETQDYLLNQAAIERFIEISPAPVLSNMLRHTLAAKPGSRRPAILSTSSDMDEILHQAGVEEPGESRANGASKNAEQPHNSRSIAAVPAPTTPAATATATATAANKSTPLSSAISVVPALPAPSKPVDDCPVPPIIVIRCLIAHKLKCSFASVSPAKPIRDFVAGKSTLQNEIIGDLQKDYGDDVPDRPEEIPLAELASALPPLTSLLGKSSLTLVARMLASKMPGA